MEVLQRTANRGSVSTGPYEIDHSLQMEDANDQNLVKNYSGDGDRRTWTYSTWIKKMRFGSASGTGQSGYDYMYLLSAAYTSILFLNNDLLRVSLYNGSSTVYADPAQKFRDGSAWYHIVVTLDSTDSTASDRVKIYINGVRVTEFDNSTYANMSQNEEFGLGEAASNYQFGYFFAGGGNNRGFSGYVADTHYVNGTALDCNSFGEFDADSGIWIPKAYTGSHGAKGFYFKFDDSSNLGKDSSSGGIGDFSVSSNLAAINQATDTPTNNFCTMNMLNRTDGNSKTQEGGTKVTTDGGSGWCSMVATMGVTKGKWYWETQRSGGSTDSNDVVTGIVGSEDAYIPYSAAAKYYIGNVATSSSIGFYTTGVPNVRNGDGGSLSNSAGDIIMIALDMDNDKIYFGVNGTWDALGTGGSSLHADFDGEFVLPAVAVYQGKQIKINFGGYASYTISSANSDADGYGNFEYTVPSGYYALCTKNLEEYG